jgi:CubicO group peptidase (beta-lactamase class C family)
VSKSWNRIETWLGLIVVAFGLLLAAIGGIWVFMSATATPLHPNAQEVASLTDATPLPRWDRAVEQGRHIVRSGLSEQNLPGVSVAVGVGGDIVWAEGFGWANLEGHAPVGPETRFAIGTASTALTSAAVGLLLEKGSLKLDEEIQAWVPQFPRKEWPVTLRQLMGHLAGVRDDGGDEGPLLSRHCERTIDALPDFAERPLLFEPGTEFHYSSYGWILVGAAVETAAGEPFHRFMQKQIFEPLGMDQTGADGAGIPDRATSYFPRFAADPRYGMQSMRAVDHSCYAGASGLVSTPSDLVRFGMAVQGGRLLQPATVQRLQASQQLASGDPTEYGLGWDLETITLGEQPIEVVGHDGDLLGGTVASLITLREHGVVVAVVSNTSYADTFGLASKIAQAFADVR